MNNLAKAFTALGFEKKDQHSSIIGLLHIAGCFDPEGVQKDGKHKKFMPGSAANFILDDEYFHSAAEALKWLKEASWKHLAREQGKELWEVLEPDFSKETREDIIQAFYTLHFIDVVKPSERDFERLIILGAAEFRVEARLDYAEKLWNEGVRFEQIYLLGSGRKVDPSVEKTAEKLKPGATQTDMMRKVFREKSKNWPQGMKNIEVIFVDTKGKRPSLEETIKSWIKEAKPKKKDKVLALSNQPFINYQKNTIETLVPGVFVAGPQVDKMELRISDAMDSLARTISRGYEKAKQKLQEESVKEKFGVTRKKSNNRNTAGNEKYVTRS